MKSSRSRRVLLAVSIVLGLGFSWTAVRAASLRTPAGFTYYVDHSAGDDGNSGLSPSAPWQTLGRVEAASLEAGDTVLLRRGESWDEDLAVSASGGLGSPLTFSAYGSGPAPVIRRLTIDGDHTLFVNLTVDHQGLAGDAVRVRARNVTLRAMTVRNGTADGIDASDADGLLIEGSHIHHFLAGSFTNQVDAHGVVATDIQGLTIRDTEIHHVSGDSFQADPSRSPNVPMDILIEDSHFWTGPLAADFQAWNAGEVPGENAIDTKVAEDNWQNVERATFTIRNLVAHGWINDGFISNRAVFNLKEKIQADFDGVTVYAAEIAFRVRGTRGNANLHLANAVIYDVEKAIRAEDDLQNLVVYHSTFGGGIDTLVQVAGGGGGVGTWDFKNNAFLDRPPPAQAPHSSNQTASQADFVHSPAHDYHLTAAAGLVDAGTLIPLVVSDRDGVGRPQGAAVDVGAYEFLPALSLFGVPGNQTISLFWTVNITLPATTTWEISYAGPPGDQPSPILGIANSARAYTLTGLTNFVPYSLTLHAMLAANPILTGTLVARPSDIFVALPVATK